MKASMSGNGEWLKPLLEDGAAVNKINHRANRISIYNETFPTIVDLENSSNVWNLLYLYSADGCIFLGTKTISKTVICCTSSSALTLADLSPWLTSHSGWTASTLIQLTAHYLPYAHMQVTFWATEVTDNECCCHVYFSTLAPAYIVVYAVCLCCIVYVRW